MVQHISCSILRRRIFSGIIVLFTAGAVCGTAFQTARAQARVPESMFNEGSATDWTNFPTQPQNLTFAAGLQGWENMEIFGERLVRGDTEYVVGIDPNVQHSGVPCPYVAARVEHPKTSSLLQQAIRADLFRGKRIRFSAYLKTENAAGASLWLRQDTPHWQKAWNRMARPIRGTTDWKEYEYVLDVAPDAQGIDFGLDLEGRGKVWIDQVKLEEVGKETPVSTPDFDSSDADYANALPRQPRNLSFLQGLAGWGKSANGNDEPNPCYEVGVDPKLRRNGAPCGYLGSKVSHPVGYGALRQDMSAENYVGKRLRLSAYLKSRDVAYSAALMICLAEPSGLKVWAMQQRPIRGTTQWKHYEYVVDVPAGTSAIMFGVSIQGRGRVWANDFRLETVGKQVAVTNETPISVSDD